MTEHESRIKKLGKGTALVASGTLVLGGLSTAGYLAYKHEDELGEITDSVYGFFTEDQCKLDKHNQEYFRALKPAQTVEFVPDLSTYAEEKALEHNLSLIRSQPFVQAVESAETKEEVLDIIRTYSANFPIDIHIPDAVDPIDFPFTYNPIDLESMDIEAYKVMTTDFLKTMHYVPREVVELAEVEKIKFVEEFKLEDYVPNPFVNTSKYFGSAYWPINNTIYVSVRAGQEDRTTDRYLSAFSSAIDLEVCGNFGSQRDSVFVDLNPEDFSYGVIEEHLTEITSNISGQIDVMRDKKNIMKDHIFPHSSPALLNESEVVQQKANLLASRIDRRVPYFHDYWSSFLNVEESNVNSS